MAKKTDTSSSWKNRMVGTGVARAKDLLANPLNARRHPEAQREALTSLLEEVGWVGAVTVNRRSGLLVDGHARVEEAAARDEEVPVQYVDLDDAEERKVLAALDAIGAMATYDADVLSSLLGQVSTDAAPLAALLSDLQAVHGVALAAPLGAAGVIGRDGKHEEKDDQSFWPVVSFRVNPATKAAWDAVWAALDGTDTERVDALLAPHLP